MDPSAAPPLHPTTPARAPAPEATPGGGAAAPLRVTSAQLFGAALEVQIDHHGAVYRLKQTALGKLILTK